MKRIIAVLLLFILAGCGGCVLHHYPAVPTDFAAPNGFNLSVHTTTISEGYIQRSGYDSHNLGSARSPGATGFVVHIRNEKLDKIQEGTVKGIFAFDESTETPLPCKHLRFPAPNQGAQNICTAYFVPTNLLKEINEGSETYKVMPYGTYKIRLSIQIEGKSAEADLTVQYKHTREITKDVFGKWN